jgi:hypothetical protein
VLYNREELPLTELCGSPACELETFRWVQRQEPKLQETAITAICIAAGCWAAGSCLASPASLHEDRHIYHHLTSTTCPRPCGTLDCREKVLGPFLLTREQHQEECMVHFMHDEPAGEHTETEEVQVGASFQEEEDQAPAKSAGKTAAAVKGTA